MKMSKKTNKRENRPLPPPNTPIRALGYEGGDDQPPAPPTNALPAPDNNGSFDWGFQYTNEPHYTAPTRAGGKRVFGPRPGIGAKDEEAGLFALVSSRNNRDIVRRNNFMPGQFDTWNAKATGGNNKFWGGYEDIDGDAVHEFVVRRNNADGPMVAVNGYTTKKSDWLARDKFYSSYPSREQRKGKTVRQFMQDEVWKPTYNANYMDVDSYDIEADDERYFGNKRYSSYKPAAKSPYRALGEHIVFPAIKAALLDIGNGTQLGAKLARQVIVEKLGTPAFEANYLSIIYEHWIKAPIINNLQQSGVLDDFMKDWQRLRSVKYGNDFSSLNDPGSEQSKDFDKWLFAKKDIKAMVKDFVLQWLTPDGIQQMTQWLTTKIIGAIEFDVQGIRRLVKQKAQEYMVTSDNDTRDFRTAFQ